jgi:UDP:flavonoid glycosyltransferase YjiC (YdhE family)
VHTEQALVAHNVMRLGAGFAAPPGGDANKVATMLDNVLNDPRFKQRASAFAAKYADYDPRQTVMRIAHSIESLLRPED